MDVAAERAEENARIDERIRARVDELNRTRGWPWQQPGEFSVALDDDGRVRRWVATETELVPQEYLDEPAPSGD